MRGPVRHDASRASANLNRSSKVEPHEHFHPAPPPRMSVSCRAAIRAGGRMACRSLCTRATPLSAICSPTDFPSSTCAIRLILKRSPSSPAPKNTRSHHLQIHGDILLAVNGPNIWAMQQYASQADYYGKPLADSVQTEQPFARRHASVRHFEPGKPARDRLSAHPRASAPIASGGSAGATPMSPCISRASSTTCWR